MTRLDAALLVLGTFAMLWLLANGLGAVLAWIAPEEARPDGLAEHEAEMRRRAP